MRCIRIAPAAVHSLIFGWLVAAFFSATTALGADRIAESPQQDTRRPMDHGGPDASQAGSPPLDLPLEMSPVELVPLAVNPNPLPPRTGPVRTLLLKNGECIVGRIDSDAESFFLFPGSGGKVVLPRGQVAQLCDSPMDAYRWLASQAPAVDTPARIKLIEWCLVNDLLQAAELEIGNLAAVSRRTGEVARLKRRLDMRIESQRRAAAGEFALHPTSPNAAQSAVQPHQVSAESLAEYTRHIQPLLLNSCAAATCHGRATETDFQLTRAPRGFQASQRLTQRNLTATLQQLNMVTPGTSSLLIKAGMGHGDAAAPFGTQNGSHDTPAYQSLKAWIEMVAGPIQPGDDAPRDRVAAKAEQGEMSNATEWDPVSAETSEGTVVSESEASDPFDPDVFNATFGDDPDENSEIPGGRVGQGGA